MDKEDKLTVMAIDKETLLASGDKALIKAAATGEGLVPLTKELLEDLGKSIQERQADIAARYPDLVAKCDYETRLAVTAWVMKNIVEHAKEGGSYRYLIYNRLGFGPDAYLPLCHDGLTISNEFTLGDDKNTDVGQ